MTHIIDYGIGNLRSIEKALEAVGADVTRSDRTDDLLRADRLVLPGVGAFGACADELRRRGLVEPILEAVERGVPLLGVCVGMQLLFDNSLEMGRHEGLGLLPGRVVRFRETYALAAAGNDAGDNGAAPDEPAASDRMKVPHMGWNTIYAARPGNPLLEGIADGAFFYFVHSYHAEPTVPDDVLAECTYGLAFPAVVNRGAIYGVQFHPEKSHRNGLRVLKNFAAL